MPNSPAGHASIKRRLGHEGWLAYLARIAAKKRRLRARKRLARLGEAEPTDPVDLRRVLGGHPEECPCFDCLWGGEAEREPRVAKWPERVRL